MPPRSDESSQTREPLTAAMIRGQLILEIAAGLVVAPDQPMRQPKVLLRSQGAADWPLTLFASSTNEGIDAVVAGEADLAIVNPSAALTLAYRGIGAYTTPQPVLPIAVIPSFDQYVFAVRSETGLASLEDIGTKHYPLRIAVRGQADHYLHLMLDHIVAAAGFSLDDVRKWGGSITAAGNMPPRSGDARLSAFDGGDIDAIFDEGVAGWLESALDRDMRVLPVAESTLLPLERMGYRRGAILKSEYPRLDADVPSLDFSGWPIFVHAQAPDKLVTQICVALDERKALIPWEGEGPLPVERMGRDTPDTPLDVPLHPAAARVWAERGYLNI